MINPEKLDVILEDLDKEANKCGCFCDAIEALNALDETQSTLKMHEQTYWSHLNEINARLAGEIRKHQPAITVKLSRDGLVVISYHRSRSKQMILRPDVRNQTWQLGDTPFEGRFTKYCSDSLGVDLPTIGKSIADYFTRSFKSLREGAPVSEGELIVEEASTDAASYAGVAKKLRDAYADLKVAHDLVRQFNVDGGVLNEINSISGRLIGLFKFLQETNATEVGEIAEEA